MIDRSWLESLALEGWRFWREDGRLRYRAPGSAATPEVLARLRAEREALAALLAEQPDALALAPLSWGQRALWFLWKLAPGSTAYHQSMPLALPSGASEAHWRTAAEAVCRRHAMLRTRIREREGDPVQHVAAAVALPWTACDAGDLPSEALEAALADAHAQPFDLARDVPVRFTWFSRPDTPVLLVTMHHVACDAWSLEILRRDLAAAAAAAREGRPWAAAAPPSLDYSDFARWQASMLDGPQGASLWDYWRERLASPRARLDLPLDHPRPAVQTYDGASVRIEAPASLASAVTDVARARGVTPFTVVLAGFLCFLHRLTRQADLLVGAPTAGRTQPEFADVVGYFVEPLVIRVGVDTEATFSEALERTRLAVGGALAHGDFPFPLLVERLHADRDPSRSPLFDVTFNFLSRRGRDGAGAADEPLPRTLNLAQADGKFDLTLTVVEHDDRLEAALGFNTNLFERATVERWGRALVHVLSAALASPERPVGALPLGDEPFGPALDGRSAPPGTLRPIHERIAEVAARWPDRTAVVAPDGDLTYSSLMARAGAVAEALRPLGVGPDVPVGLRAGRSVDFVSGMLGILMAGGAFVPLDPDQPAAVGERAIARAGAAAVVESGGQVVPRTGAMPGAHPERPPLERLAYVIFTSGSTGEPKGVGVEHRALANYVASIVQDLDIAPGGHHAFVSSVAADLGHTVLFPALATGGTLHLFSREAVTDRHAFAAAMGRGIDYLKIVPSHLAALLDPEAPALPARGLFLGGEAASPAWVRQVVGRAGCRVFNHYGPTETTVGVMTGEWVRPREPHTASLPLDTAVQNTRIWILGDDRRPVPPGIPGEIWISGASLARGYVGDPRLTAERFADLPGIGRAYRTGDVGRLTAEGLLVGGRVDRQVKLRGYRVDPAQVESVLAGIPGVRQAAVLPDADGPAASVLNAWVAMDEQAFDAGALRTELAGVLPSYMLPARIVRLDRLPVTTNGKLDAARLRRELTAHAQGAQVSVPRDVLELRLARIWAEVLDAPSVGIHDDFFELGGHSLRAVQVASRLHDELGVRVPLATFFRARTVAALADVIRAAGDREDRLVPLQAAGAARPLVCFPGAGGGLLYFQYLAAALEPLVPVWGAQPPLTREAATDVHGLAVLFADALQSEPRIAPPYRLAGHSFGALVAYETAAVLRARGAAVERIIVLDNPAPAAGPSRGQEHWDDGRWARHIAARIERLYGVELGVEPAGDAAGGPDWLLDRLLASGLLPAGTSRAYFRRYVEGYKTNVRAAHTYRPSAAALDVPILVVRAAERDAAIDLAGDAGGDLGWGSMSSAGVGTLIARGTHITMLTEPNVRDLASALLATLDDAARPAVP